MERKIGFEPIYDAESRVLILGSFPSVKSRQVDFYYGNKQNRFWKMLTKFFNFPMLNTKEEKIKFLQAHHIAIWDIVTECEIIGSQDTTIKNYNIADLTPIFDSCKLTAILLNGGRAFEIFEKAYQSCGIAYYKMPSTSPANTTYREEVWFNELSRIFNGTQSSC